MNIFRSEEHARNWPRFDQASVEGIVPLETLVQLFSGNLFKKRLEPDYFARGMYLNEFMADVAGFAKTRPFWKMPAG
jgi:hypothetical protein